MLMLPWEASAQSAAASRPTYTGRVRLDPGTAALDGRWTLHMPRVAADSITLLLNVGLDRVRVGGRLVARVARDTSRGLNRLTIYLRPATAPRQVILEVATLGTLQMSGEGINTVSAAYVELGLDSFWFPVIDGFPDFTGTLRITLPAPLHLVSSGTVRRAVDARTVSGRIGVTATSTIVSSVPLPDFAFVAARTFTTVASPRVRAYSTSADSALVRAMLDVANRCAGYLVERYGEGAPMPPVELLLPPRTGPGYARKHYIVVPVGEWIGAPGDAAARAASQTGFLCHELAHFWSTGAVATGPENWLNEGFAEFVSGRAVRALRGDSAYAAVQAQWRARAMRVGAVWTPAATSRPSANASYGKAPLLLATLEERIGADRMDRLLVQFMTRPLRSTRAVLDMIAAEAGRETADWFERALGDEP
jgi:aminopeptidase N